MGRGYDARAASDDLSRFSYRRPSSPTVGKLTGVLESAPMNEALC